MSSVPALPIERLRESLAQSYTIDRELGRGGMSAVFLANDCKYRRSVAIKVLHPELAASLGPERFLQEIQLAARLNHPHILPLFDSGRSDRSKPALQRCLHLCGHRRPGTGCTRRAGTGSQPRLGRQRLDRARQRPGFASARAALPGVVAVNVSKYQFLNRQGATS